MEEKSNPYLIPLAIIVAGLVIAAAIYFRGPAAPAQPSLEDIPPVSKKDHILGSLEAAIKIVVYTDLECPYCRDFHPTLKQAFTDYGSTGQLAIVYRNLPLSIHPKAFQEHMAAECAAKLGGNEKYWAFIDRIFAITPANNGLDLAELPKTAGLIGLDLEKFNQCLTSRETQKLVETDMAEAENAGGSGTPFPIVFSKSEGILGALPGALPYLSQTTPDGREIPGLKDVIEQALAENAE